MRDYFSARAFLAFAPPVLAIGAVCVLAAAGAPMAPLAACLGAVIVLAVAIGVQGARAPRMAALAFGVAVLTAIGVLSAGGPALAAEAAANGVTFDLGAILSPLVQVLGAGLLAVATWAVSFLPAVIRAMLTEQLLKRAVDYAVATVAGAAAGKTVSIDVANEMIRVAAQYAADNGPKITKWLADSLGTEIIARLGDVVKLPDDSSAVDLNHNPQPQS